MARKRPLSGSVYFWHIQAVIDFSRVEGFQWDTGNDRKNADRHGVSQGEAEQVFFNEPLLILSDDRHSCQEPRFHALGRTEDGRLLHITFTLREQRRWIRVISARDMHRKERMRYGQDA
jgi:uncharacterized DUF497 family protein